MKTPTSQTAPSWLHAGASSDSLAWIRTLFCLFWIVKLLLVPLHELSWLPATLAQAVFPFTLIPQESFEALIQSEWALRTLQWSGIFFLAYTIFGKGKAKLLSLLFSAFVLTLFTSLLRTFSHVNHGDVPLLLCMWVMALDSAASPYASEAYKQTQPERQLFSMTAVFCLSYMLVGAFRLASSGVELYFRQGLEIWLLERSLTPGLIGYAWGDDVVQSTLLSQIFRISFLGITIMEIIFPLALFSRYVRYLALAFMLPSHIGIFLTMNIFFPENMLMFLLLIPMGKNRCLPGGSDLGETLANPEASKKPLAR